MHGTSPGKTPERAARASHRVPREHVARAFKRRERGTECALELLVELLRCPAVGTVDRADRARLVEQEHLVVAYAENLPGYALGAVGSKVDRERRDLLRRHLLEALDPALLLL